MGGLKKSKKTSEFHGVLLVDKPAGITSHDVVDRVRRIYATRRVGHCGTLDPQATGLLALLLGEATRISENLVGLDKSYEGTMRLGCTSDTYDAQGEIVPTEQPWDPPTLQQIQEAATEFTGEIEQLPPPYSAKKVAGKKLYEYARKGETPEVEPREIRVDDFEILEIAPENHAVFGVDCSTGTYVRTLVHDLGRQLGCGAILTELRRTDLGHFHIEDAHTLEALAALETKAELRRAVIPIRRALPHVPTVWLLPNAEPWVRRGQAIPHNLVQTEDDAIPTRGSMVLLCRLDGLEVALARVDPAPLSPPPKALRPAMAPWYQPLKQFSIDPPGEDPAEEESTPAPLHRAEKGEK